jgi:hypothetical protein
MHPLNSFFHANLSIQKIPLTKEHRSAFAKCAMAWHEVADQKFSITERAKPREQFWASRTVTRLIAKSLQAKRYKKRFQRMYVAFEPTTKTIQAIALTKKHVLKTAVNESLGTYDHVLLLATNPINIQAPCNNCEPHRIRGAGSSLIQHLHKISAEKKRNGLYLEAVKSSVGFYKKMNFFTYEPTEIKMLQKRTFPMVLPVANLNN